jgi:hypothetical protein
MESKVQVRLGREGECAQRIETRRDVQFYLSHKIAGYGMEIYRHFADLRFEVQ